MDPTLCLDACVSKEVAPLRMVTGVVPATMSPMLKSEQRSMKYEDKECKNGSNLSFLNICVFLCTFLLAVRGALYICCLGSSHCDWH